MASRFDFATNGRWVLRQIETLSAQTGIELAYIMEDQEKQLAQ